MGNQQSGSVCVCVLGILPQTLTYYLHLRQQPLPFGPKREISFHNRNQYAARAFRPTHICGNDHSWRVVTAVSARVQDFNWLL